MAAPRCLAPGHAPMSDDRRPALDRRAGEKSPRIPGTVRPWRLTGAHDQLIVCGAVTYW